MRKILDEALTSLIQKEASGPKVEVLFATPWIEMHRMKDPEQGVNGYDYVHEIRCKGNIVAVLPYRRAENGEFEYMVRHEVTPCWGMEPVLASTTGGCEEEDFREDAVRELKEEAGYDVTIADMIELGTCRGTKSSDTVYHLYTCDLTGKDAGEITGDGSEMEAKAWSTWESDFANDIQDPMLGMCLVRMQERLGGGLGVLPDNANADVEDMAKSAAVEEEREIRVQLTELPEEVKSSPETVVERIEQGFIAMAPGGTDVRIRKASIDGVESYTMTAKHRPLYQEAEMEISKEIFESLWPTVKKPMLKTRYKWQGWDVDALDSGEIWAEFELEEGQGQVKLPSAWQRL